MSWYAERKYLVKDIAGIETVIQSCAIKQALMESREERNSVFVFSKVAG